MEYTRLYNDMKKTEVSGFEAFLKIIHCISEAGCSVEEYDYFTKIKDENIMSNYFNNI